MSNIFTILQKNEEKRRNNQNSLKIYFSVHGMYGLRYLRTALVRSNQEDLSMTTYNKSHITVTLLQQ